MHVCWRFPLSSSFTFLLPVEVDDPIEVKEKLVEVAGCWRKVVVNVFNRYSPIVYDYLFPIVRDLAGESMYG